MKVGESLDIIAPTDENIRMPFKSPTQGASDLDDALSSSSTGNVTNQMLDDAKARGNSSRAKNRRPAVSSSHIIKTPKQRKKRTFGKPLSPKVCIWNYN